MEDMKEEIQSHEESEVRSAATSTVVPAEVNTRTDAFIMSSRSVGKRKPTIIEDDMSIYEAASLAMSSSSSGAVVLSSSQPFNERYRDSRYNLFDRLGSSLKKMSTSFGFEKNYRTLTIQDINKGNTATVAIGALKLVSEKLYDNGGGSGSSSSSSSRKNNEGSLSGHEDLLFACLHCLIRVMSSPTDGAEYKRVIGKTQGTLQHLSSLLSSCKNNVEVMWRGIHCIFLLSSEAANGDRLGDSGFCEIVTEFLVSIGKDEQSKSLSSTSAFSSTASNDNDEAIVNCLKAIKHLSDSNKNQNRLREIGLCGVIMKILLDYTSMHHSLTELWSTSDKQGERNEKSTDIQELCKRLQHVSNVIEWTSRVIYNLSYGNSCVKTSFHALQACEKLLDSLHILSKENVLFAEDIPRYEWIVRAISSLCQEHEENKKAFADASGCQVVRNLLVKGMGLVRNEIGIDYVDFTTSGTATMMSLLNRDLSEDSTDEVDNGNNDNGIGEGNKTNITAIVGSSGNMTLPTITSLAAMTSAAPLLESLLTLIADSSDPYGTTQARYYESGVILVVLEILSTAFSTCVASSKFHAKIDSTTKHNKSLYSVTSSNNDALQAACIEAALKAIRNLSHNYPLSLELIFKNKSECMILAILRYFGIECASVTVTAQQGHSISQWGLFALCSFGSSSLEYRELLGKEGACNDVSNVLLKQVGNPEVSQWACHTVGTLAHQSEENAIKFDESWVCRGLALTLQKHMADVDVIEEVCFAISSLCEAYDRSRSSMMSVSTGEYMIIACKRYLDNKHGNNVLVHIISAVKALVSTKIANDSVTTNLGELGLCKLLAKIFSKHQSNIQVTKGCLHCIIALSSNKAEFAKELGSTNEIIGNFGNMLGFIGNDTEAMLLFLGALRSLASNLTNAKKISSSSNNKPIFQWIATLLDHFMEEEEIVLSAVSTISELAIDPSCAEIFGSLGVHTVLVSLLSGHRKNIQVVSNALRATGRLASRCAKNASRLGTNGACGSILVVLETHLADVVVCKYACEAIAGLTVNSLQNRNIIGSSSSTNVSTLLLTALERHKDDESIVAVILHSIATLMENSPLNKKLFFDGGLCGVIVNCLKEYTRYPKRHDTENKLADKNDSNNNLKALDSSEPSNVDQGKTMILQWAVLCMCRLLATTQSQSNNNHPSKESLQRIFAEDGACIAVTATLDANITKPLIVEYSLNAMTALATDFSENATIFIAIAASEAICRAIRYNNHLESIAYAGISALISFKTPDGILSSENVCKLIPGVLRKFGHADKLVEAACQLIYFLCKGFSKNPENDTNRTFLGLHGACEEVVAALGRHTSNEASLLITSSTSRAGAALAVQWACLAIYVLGHDHKEHQERFGKCGACESVGRAVSSSNNGFAYSEDAAYAACQAICALAKGNKRHQIALGNTGACGSVIEALHQHPASVGIARWGLLAVSVLAENSETNSQRFGDNGATSIITLTLHTHQTTAAVALSGCAAIKSIANVSLNFTQELGQYGACESTIAALNLHMSDPRVVAEGCRAIASLARYLGNASWFGPAQAAEAIMTAVSTHQHDPGVLEAAFLAVERLCIDQYMSERLAAADALSQAVHVMSLEATSTNANLTLVICRSISRLVKGNYSTKFEDVCRILSNVIVLYSSSISSIQSGVAIVSESAKALVYLLKSISDDVEDKKNFMSLTGNLAFTSPSPTAPASTKLVPAENSHETNGPSETHSSQTSRKRPTIKECQIMLKEWNLCGAIDDIFNTVFKTPEIHVPDGGDKPAVVVHDEDSIHKNQHSLPPPPPPPPPSTTTATTAAVATNSNDTSDIQVKVSSPYVKDTQSNNYNGFDLMAIRTKNVTAFYKNLCLLIHFLSRGNESTQAALSTRTIIGSLSNLFEMVLVNSLSGTTAEMAEQNTVLMMSLSSAISSLTGSVRNEKNSKVAHSRVLFGEFYACEALAVCLGRYVNVERQQSSTNSTAAFVYQRGRAGLFRTPTNDTVSKMHNPLGGFSRSRAVGVDDREVESTSKSLLSASPVPGVKSSQTVRAQMLSLQLVKTCCHAVTNLMQGNKGNKTAFAAAGLPELMIGILSDNKYLNAVSSITIKVDNDVKVLEYSDSSIVEYALLSLQALLADVSGEGKKRLSSTPQLVSKTVASLLSTRDDPNGLVVYLCCSIISRLCSDGAEVNQNSLGHAGVCAILVTLLHKLCAYWYHLDSNSSKTSDTTSVTGDSASGSVSSDAETHSRGVHYNEVTPVKVNRGSGNKSNKSMTTLFKFSPSFTLENSKSLANELCRALLELTGVNSNDENMGETSDQNQKAGVNKIHRDNLFRLKSLLIETSRQPTYNGVDVLMDGRSVIDCYLSKCSQVDESSAYNIDREKVASPDAAARGSISKSSSGDMQQFTSDFGGSSSSSCSNDPDSHLKLDREALRLCKKILDITKPPKDGNDGPIAPSAEFLVSIEK